MFELVFFFSRLAGPGGCSQPGGTSIQHISCSIWPNIFDGYPMVGLFCSFVCFLHVCGSWGVVPDDCSSSVFFSRLAGPGGLLAAGWHLGTAYIFKYASCSYQQVSHGCCMIWFRKFLARIWLVAYDLLSLFLFSSQIWPGGCSKLFMS